LGVVGVGIIGTAEHVAQAVGGPRGHAERGRHGVVVPHVIPAGPVTGGVPAVPTPVAPVVILQPVLPVVASLVAVLLPILAGLAALLLPILPHLAPVARRQLTGAVVAGKSLLKGVAALLRRAVGGQLAGARPAVAQAR